MIDRLLLVSYFHVCVRWSVGYRFASLVALSVDSLDQKNKIISQFLPQTEDGWTPELVEVAFWCWRFNLNSFFPASPTSSLFW